MPIQELYTELLKSEARNGMIVADVIKAVAQGRNPLVLTERKPHVEAFARALREELPNVITLIGGQSTKARREAMAQVSAVPPEQPLVIVATGKYVGEGFDAPRLDTLFLAMPVAWQGTIAQYSGRLHRLFDGKSEVQIYDYVDLRVPVLDRMYAKRVRAYSSIGYKVKCGGRLPRREASFTTVKASCPFSRSMRVRQNARLSL